MVSEAARNLGIHENLLGRWKRALIDPSSNVLNGDSEAALKVELSRLRKENKQLRMEREILKKVAAFFVKEKS